MIEELQDKTQRPQLAYGQMSRSHWIDGAIKHPGALRKTLHAKKGKKIPDSTLESSAKKSGVTGRRARLAITLRKFGKHKK